VAMVASRDSPSRRRIRGYHPPLPPAAVDMRVTLRGPEPVGMLGGRVRRMEGDVVFSLELTEEQQQARKWAHDFAEKEIRPVARRHDEEESFPWEVVEKAAEIGLYGLDYYQMTGSDPSGLTSGLIVEEIFWGCGGIGLAIFGSGLALAGLAAAGTGEQFSTWAPRIFGTGDEVKVGAFAVTEPDAGSDVSRIRTRARREGDGWVLNGEKIYITNGGIADVHVVVATVDPSLGHRGQASFIVTQDMDGFSMAKKDQKLGIRASHTASIVLDDVYVPADHLLGGEEKLNAKMERARQPDTRRKHGRSGALATFEATRPIVGIQAVGIARAAFEWARDYALQRHTFGVPIIRHQGVAFKLADMATEIDAARLLCWRGLWMAATNQTYVQGEGSMAKLKAGRVAVTVTDDAIQIGGGMGYLREAPVEKWHRDAKIYEIFEGTAEIQRLVISRQIARSAGGEA
jgi:acyl-CoA dehydrogenase